MLTQVDVYGLDPVWWQRKRQDPNIMLTQADVYGLKTKKNVPCQPWDEAWRLQHWQLRGAGQGLA